MPDGVILAGGRSTRFDGADKAVVELAGIPMIRRVADRLTTVVDSLVINCRAEQVDRIDAALGAISAPTTFAPDPEPDLGPMAGIRAGLPAADADYVAVVACDMPFVESRLLGYLFERAAGHDAAVVRLDDGWIQTTQAVYRREPMAAACRRAIERGDRRIVAAFDDLDVIVVDEATAGQHAGLETFDNLNTRAEFDEAAARLADE